MARPNMKSVRLSNEALAIVESAPGEGFNDKFEKLIFSYKNTIPTRLAQLEEIEKKIAQKNKEFETLRMIGYKVEAMVNSLNKIAGEIPNVSLMLNSVSQEARQASTGLRSNEIQDYTQLSYEGNVHEEDFPEEEF